MLLSIQRTPSEEEEEWVGGGAAEMKLGFTNLADFTEFWQNAVDSATSNF
jgi:hypothetical protein